MRISFLVAAAVGVTVVSTGAKADLLISTVNGLGNFDANVLFQAQSTDVNSAAGFSNGQGKPQIITFSSGDLFNTQAGGQALITPSGSTFNDLTLTASGTASAYTALLLNIDVATNETVTFTSPTLITSGATQQLSANGNNFILIQAQNGETFSSISFATSGDISDVKQTRVDFASAVPEPSTWAMMGLGFAAIGLFAYRRRDEARFRLI